MLPKNVWVLAIVQPLVMSSAPVMIFVGGLLGTHLAPDPKMATLPLAIMIVGTALFTIPAAMLMKLVGRKQGSLLGLFSAFIGALLAAYAAYVASFLWLLIGSLLMGVSLAFMQQFRFAALESLANPDDAGKAISVLMLGGIVAAFLGPEVALMAKDWVPSPHGFVGSFIGLAGLILLGMLVFTAFKNPQFKDDEIIGEARPLREIMRQPVFIVAVLAGVVGYGIMSFLMTATPVSMHEMNGHSLQDTKFVIQSHIAAMFLPSLFTAVLFKYLGLNRLLLLGSLLYGVVVIFGLMGQHVLHFWWALVILGVGWNFLFVGGTALLPSAYQPSERFKVQAANDFIVFAIQAIASLSAGWLVFAFGWNWLIIACIPVTVLMFAITLWYMRQNQKLAVATS